MDSMTGASMRLGNALLCSKSMNLTNEPLRITFATAGGTPAAACKQSGALPSRCDSCRQRTSTSLVSLSSTQTSSLDMLKRLDAYRVYSTRQHANLLA